MTGPRPGVMPPAGTVLPLLLLAQAVGGSGNFTTPPPLEHRSVYLSIFDTTRAGSNGNPNCQLGSPSSIMGTMRLHETGEYGYGCDEIMLLSIITNQQVFYSLKLSGDGQSIESIKVGCDTKDTCGKCLIEEYNLTMNDCHTIGNLYTGLYSVSFSSESAPCFGPHTISDNTTKTVFGFVQVPVSSRNPSAPPGGGFASRCNFTIATGTIGMSIDARSKVEECHTASLFGKLPFTYYVSTTGDSYSLRYCNTSACPLPKGHEATCQSIFDALPLDQCNPTSLFGLGIESVQIVPSANLTICQQQRPPGSTTATPPDGPVPPRYAYMAAGIAVGLVVVSVGVVVWRKTVLQRRERYTYQPLN